MKYNFEKFCKDYRNIENYDKAATDNFEGWCCHHRRQTWDSNGERLEADVSAAELIALGQYYNVSADELIFLTASEHMSLHKKGKKFSEEHREKLSEAHKGEKHHMYGKHHSEEVKKKMSKPKSDEAKKKMSIAKKNMTEYTKKKIAAANIGLHWYHNDVENIRAKECPPGYVLGMSKRK